MARCLPEGSQHRTQAQSASPEVGSGPVSGAPVLANDLKTPRRVDPRRCRATLKSRAERCVVLLSSWPSVSFPLGQGDNSTACLGARLVENCLGADLVERLPRS